MPFRFSIRWLLVAVIYVAIAAAAFKQGWWIWADLLWGTGWLAWGYAVLTACVGTGATRVGAAGFAIFLGCYGLSAQFAPASLPTERILKVAGIEQVKYLPPPPAISYPPGDIDEIDLVPYSTTPDAKLERELWLWEPRLRAAHSVGAIFSGLAGLCLGLLVWRQASWLKSSSPAAAIVVTLTALLANGGALAPDGAFTYVEVYPSQSSRIAPV